MTFANNILITKYFSYGEPLFEVSESGAPIICALEIKTYLVELALNNSVLLLT